MNALNARGFTAKEFALTLAAITALCFAAIPPFYALQNAHRRTVMEQTIATLKEKIATLEKEQIPLPLILDLNPAQSPCLTCFKNILEKETNDPLWFKVNETTYLYSVNGNLNGMPDYQETGDFKMIYDFSKGEIAAEEMR